MKLGLANFHLQPSVVTAIFGTWVRIVTHDFGHAGLDSDLGLVLDLETTSGIGLGMGTPAWTGSPSVLELTCHLQSGPGLRGLGVGTWVKSPKNSMTSAAHIHSAVCNEGFQLGIIGGQGSGDPGGKPSIFFIDLVPFIKGIIPFHSILRPSSQQSKSSFYNNSTGIVYRSSNKN